MEECVNVKVAACVWNNSKTLYAYSVDWTSISAYSNKCNILYSKMRQIAGIDVQAAPVHVSPMLQYYFINISDEEFGNSAPRYPYMGGPDGWVNEACEKKILWNSTTTKV